MKKIVYIDMDEVLCDFLGSYKEYKKRYPEMEYPQNKYGFWMNLKPKEGAIEAVKFLQQYFDVYILSTASVYNPNCFAEKAVWIERHLGFDVLPKLILSANKGLNKGDFLIDDKIEGNGQENFEGTLIRFGYGEFKDWNSVIQYFKEKELTTY